MSDDHETRGRAGAGIMGLAVAATLAAPGLACDKQQPETLQPDEQPDEQADEQPVAADTDADDANEAGDEVADTGEDDTGEADTEGEIPEDGGGDWSNPGSVRG